MYKILLPLLLSSLLSASSLTLKQIQERLEKTHPFFLSQEEKEALHEATIHATWAQAPLNLSTSGAQAYPDEGDDAFEYSLSLSKTLPLGNQRTKQLEIAHLKHQAHKLQMQQKYIAFMHEINRAYHDSCLNRQQREAFRQLVEEFEILFKKKRKAYRYKDISKKELLQLKIEKASLRQELENLKAKEEISKQALLDLLEIEGDDSHLSCKDLYPMEFNPPNKDALFSLSKRAFEEEIHAANKSAKLYDRKFENVDLSLGYDHEIDTKRYGVALALPLSFTSQKNEYKKIAAIHEGRLLKLQKRQALLEKKRTFKQLQAKLKNEQNIVIQTKNNIQTFRKELLPLIEMSYQLGESSVVEYLLSKQKLWQLQESLSLHKKNYYNTLFRLLTIAEFKEIK
jgi:outer membrane protein TolC